MAANQQASDLQRRKLLIATSGLYSVGLAATMVPFVKSMSPSEAAKAAGAPVEVDTTGVQPGAMTTVEWRGRPIWILRRTDAMLASLNTSSGQLVDPQSTEPQQPPYAKNPTRSIQPALFVVTGICTHLGCVPAYRPEPGGAELGADWPGGFYCPCHGSKFDLAGRVFKNVPAPTNLEIPPHSYLTDTRLLIGEDGKRG